MQEAAIGAPSRAVVTPRPQLQGPPAFVFIAGFDVWADTAHGVKGRGLCCCFENLRIRTLTVFPRSSSSWWGSYMKLLGSALHHAESRPSGHYTFIQQTAGKRLCKIHARRLHVSFTKRIKTCTELDLLFDNSVPKPPGQSILEAEKPLNEGTNLLAPFPHESRYRAP